MYLVVVILLLFLISIFSILREGVDVVGNDSIEIKDENVTGISTVNEIKTNAIKPKDLNADIVITPGANKTVSISNLTSATINLTSDKRIKHHIETLTPEESLDILRRMKPVKYQFKDGIRDIFGFIAQEIQEILPSSVTCRKQVIHNIYDSGICHGNILTFSTFNTKDLVNKTLKVNEETVHILEVLDKSTVRIDKSLEGSVFVYGQEVDDFLSIDNNQIFTITTSAVQEMDKDLQSTISTLRQTIAQIEEEKQRIHDEFATMNHSLLERVSKLERMAAKE